MTGRYHYNPAFATAESVQALMVLADVGRVSDTIMHQAWRDEWWTPGGSLADYQDLHLIVGDLDCGLLQLVLPARLLRGRQQGISVAADHNAAWTQKDQETLSQVCTENL